MATALALFTDQAAPQLSDVDEKRPVIRGAFLGDYDLQTYGFAPQGRAQGRPARGVTPARTFGVYISRRHEADTAQAELRWLQQHRRQYAGRWVALRGDTILAEGRTSQEVFRAVRGARPIPRVVLVEGAEDLPFGGW